MQIVRRVEPSICKPEPFFENVNVRIKSIKNTLHIFIHTFSAPYFDQSDTSALLVIHTPSD